MADDEKPKHKDAVISVRVPHDIADAARKRAGKRGIASIIRGFLTLFALGEFPEPPVTDDTRAAQRPSRRRKSKR